MWSAPADSKLCFRLTKTGRFNGEYTDKPLLISSSSVAFYIFIMKKSAYENKIFR